jgi:hypothetical protein
MTAALIYRGVWFVVVLAAGYPAEGAGGSHVSHDQPLHNTVVVGLAIVMTLVAIVLMAADVLPIE